MHVSTWLTQHTAAVETEDAARSACQHRGRQHRELERERAKRNMTVEQKPSLWDKVDYSLVVVPVVAEPTADAQKKADEQKRAWRRLRPVLDALGTLFWVYVFVKVFVFDVDAVVLGGLARYRFFIFVAVAMWLVLTIRKTWPILATFAYILCFPLVVIFWKVPKLLYKTKSPIAFMTAANAVTSVFADLKRAVIVGGVIAFSALVVVTSYNGYLLTAAALALAVVLVMALYRTIQASVVPNRFLQVQQKAIRRALDAKFMRTLLAPTVEFRDVEVEKFTQGQQAALIQDLGNSVLSHRLLNFWAYQLERYRRSPASVLLNGLAYLWLLFRTVMGLTLMNVALYHADAHAYVHKSAPTFLEFVRYVIAGLYGSEIQAMQPKSQLANALAVATFAVGVVVLGSAILSSFLSFRASRDDSEIQSVIGEIKREGETLDQQVRENFDVSVPEAIQRLDELKFGLMSLITALSTRIPKEFEEGAGG